MYNDKDSFNFLPLLAQRQYAVRIIILWFKSLFSYNVSAANIISKIGHLYYRGSMTLLTSFYIYEFYRIFPKFYNRGNKYAAFVVLCQRKKYRSVWPKTILIKIQTTVNAYDISFEMFWLDSFWSEIINDNKKATCWCQNWFHIAIDWMKTQLLISNHAFALKVIPFSFSGQYTVQVCKFKDMPKNIFSAQTHYQIIRCWVEISSVRICDGREPRFNKLSN